MATEQSNPDAQSSVEMLKKKERLHSVAIRARQEAKATKDFTVVAAYLEQGKMNAKCFADGEHAKKFFLENRIGELDYIVIDRYKDQIIYMI